MKKRILASTPYDVITGQGFSALGETLKALLPGKRILVLTDENVAPLYLDGLLSALGGFTAIPYIIKAGEASKCIENFASILSFMATNRLKREDAVLALGGGVVGDLAGFCAASYMRGIRFVQCPTTLLAMVDSSVGGKTALDLPEGKNLVGAFHQPSLVYINLDTLKTLPFREVRSGMGEIVKYAFIDNKSVSEEMLKAGPSEELILSSIGVKASLVEADEFDRGRRALLNLGHTVGHAVEHLSSFSLSHGAAVCRGLAKAVHMSKKYYSFSDEKESEMLRLLSYADEELSCPFSDEELLRLILHDKKATAGGVTFVLVRDLGDCRTVSLTEEKIKELLL